MAEAATAQKQYSPKVQDMVQKLGGFTLLELAELVEAMESEFGITPAAAAPIVVAGPAAGAAAGEGEAAAEATSFKVILKGFGENKINVIKAVRGVTTLGLKEAKALVEGAPADVAEGLSKEDAEKMAAALKEAGADVEVKPE